MKTKSLLVISLALLLIAGLQCKKEQESTTIETWGYVIDEVTKMPVEGAKVLFYNSRISTSQSHSTWLMDSTYTDQNGFFKKKWTLLKGEATQMNWSKPGYYYSKGLKMNAKGDVGQLSIKPNKNFRLYIKNIPPVREDDSFYLDVAYYTDNDYRSLKPKWFVGNYDTLVNMRVVYDEPYWTLTYFFKDSTGAGHYYRGNPYCTPHDTCDIYFEY